MSKVFTIQKALNDLPPSFSLSDRFITCFTPSALFSLLFCEHVTSVPILAPSYLSWNPPLCISSWQNIPLPSSLSEMLPSQWVLHINTYPDHPIWNCKMPPHHHSGIFDLPLSCVFLIRPNHLQIYIIIEPLFVSITLRLKFKLCKSKAFCWFCSL